MRYDEFLARLLVLGGFESEKQARDLVGAAAETLSERLPADAIRPLAEALPEEVRGFFKPRDAAAPEEFSVEELFARVSRRAGTGLPETVRGLRAVAEVVQEAVPGEVMTHIYRVLPYEIRQVFDAGPAPGESRSVTI